MPRRITILIDEEGNCQIEGHGFQGPACDRVIREIEQALGTRTSVRHKPEYRQTRAQRQVQQGG